jgi:predicted lipid-binding transport protein (Tim44 family)
VLPLWAAARTSATPQGQYGFAQREAAAGPTVEAPRPVLLSLAAGLGVGSLLVFLLDGLAPTDSSGASTGVFSALSTVLTIALLAAGVLLALRWRGPLFPPVVSSRIAMLNANLVPPPVAQAQARRALRQQYRALAERDPALAREIGVGRPHLARELDDGGLLDLNSVPAPTLMAVAELTQEQADEVIALRTQRHGLATVDELVVYGTLPPTVVDRLREYAVFLPV